MSRLAKVVLALALIVGVSGIGYFYYAVSDAVYVRLLFPSLEPKQPIEFSHKIHAGQNDIPCLFCHLYARRSRVSGVPSVQRCVGCHALIRNAGNERVNAKESKEINKLFSYWEKKEPIPWVKVHDLPDFVYFPHKRHVGAKVKCQECHGPVETMDRVKRVAPFQMGWCLQCHETRWKKVGGPRGPRDCWECHI